jgi:hypothetical protein
MGEVISKIQFQVKKKSSDMGTYIFRVLTGGWIGMVFAHFFQILFEFENFLFLFVIVIMTGAVVRITRGWGFFSVILLNVFCILLGVLLQMYVQIAPGA